MPLRTVLSVGFTRDRSLGLEPLTGYCKWDTGARRQEQCFGGFVQREGIGAIT